MTWNIKNITPRDYFILATNQFPKRGCSLSAWYVADTETFYSHGLIAAAYINEESHHVVIAFQMIGDTGLTQETINYARDFAAHAKEQASRLGFKASYTGKALGGSLAELCAVQDKLPAHTFDSLSILETESAA